MYSGYTTPRLYYKKRPGDNKCIEGLQQHLFPGYTTPRLYYKKRPPGDNKCIYGLQQNVCTQGTQLQGYTVRRDQEITSVSRVYNSTCSQVTQLRLYYKKRPPGDNKCIYGLQQNVCTQVTQLQGYTIRRDHQEITSVSMVYNRMCVLRLHNSKVIL